MDWPLAPSYWMGLQSTIIQTPGATAPTTLLGDYSVPTDQGASASQAQGSQDHQGFGNCVLDGHVSYNLPGISTYWYYRVKLGGPNYSLGLPGTGPLIARALADGIAVPSYVQQWFAAWDKAMPPFLPPNARIRKLVLSNTLAAWAPPAGGLWPADPGLGPNCADCPVQAVIQVLQQNENLQWVNLVRAYPAYLAVMPAEPWSGVAPSGGTLYATSSGQVYQQTVTPTFDPVTGAPGVSMLTNDPVTIITDPAPAYAPPVVAVQVAGQGATPVLLTPAQVAATTNPPTGAGPASSVGVSSAAVLSAQPPTTIASVTPVPINWSKWGALAAVGALLLVVLTMKVK